MNNYEFKVGDVVMLKSGGPRMAVTEISASTEGAKELRVAWEADGFIRSSTLPPECVKAARE